jgi:hypothetical protein
MSLWTFKENFEGSGNVNLADDIASVDSANGRVKKHNLYNMHPRALKFKGTNLKMAKREIGSYKFNLRLLFSFSS